MVAGLMDVVAYSIIEVVAWLIDVVASAGIERRY